MPIVVTMLHHTLDNKLIEKKLRHKASVFHSGELGITVNDDTSVLKVSAPPVAAHGNLTLDDILARLNHALQSDASPIDNKDVKCIIVDANYGSMGNNLANVSLIKELTNMFPAAKIIALSGTVASLVNALKQFPDIYPCFNHVRTTKELETMVAHYPQFHQANMLFTMFFEPYTAPCIGVNDIGSCSDSMLSTSPLESWHDLKNHIESLSAPNSSTLLYQFENKTHSLHQTENIPQQNTPALTKPH